MNKVLTLFIVGLSVGLGNFAASVAIGLSGTSKTLRAKVAVIFGLFETGMPILGLFIGSKISNYLGSKANLLGGLLLIVAGGYELIGYFKKIDNKEARLVVSNGIYKLLIAALALSLDNLIVGFSLGAYKSPLFISALTIGITSIALSLIGLEIGDRLGTKARRYSEFISGGILVLVGFAVLFKFI